MCIIVVKPENVVLSNNMLENMWENNPHGAGFMWAHNGELYVQKGLMNFQAFLRNYNLVKKQKLVIHFRWRSSGPINPNLTHPFFLNKNVAMVHNGTIKLKVPKNWSDSLVLANYLGKAWQDPMKILNDSLKRSNFLSKVGRSKFVFMDKFNEIKIINGHMGVVFNNCWFSNHSFLEKKYYEKNFEKEDYNPKNWEKNNVLITV